MMARVARTQAKGSASPRDLPDGGSLRPCESSEHVTSGAAGGRTRMMATDEPRRDRATRRDSGEGEPPQRRHAEDGDAELVERLRRGDEAAFAALVDEHHASMIRLARLHVESVAAAEEVAQQAWLGVLRGLAAFEGRCTLKAWIFSIVAN